MKLKKILGGVLVATFLFGIGAGNVSAASADKDLNLVQLDSSNLDKDKKLPPKNDADKIAPNDKKNPHQNISDQDKNKKRPHRNISDQDRDKKRPHKKDPRKISPDNKKNPPQIDPETKVNKK